MNKKKQTKKKQYRSKYVLLQYLQIFYSQNVFQILYSRDVLIVRFGILVYEFLLKEWL